MNDTTTAPVATPAQEAERDRLFAYVIAGIRGEAPAYPPLEAVQARIDAGDAAGAGELLERMHVDGLGHRQYAGKWTRPVVSRVGGVELTDAWFVATVATPLLDRHGRTVLPAGRKVLARAERTLAGYVDGYSVFNVAAASCLGLVSGWHLDTRTEPSAATAG